ncbi:23S rRNA (adenine(2030)-N(6))-methyltransferase RlmJ [Luteimonas sp. A478]
MNYRHAFHAGNHADVLKHVVLLALCDALTVKPAPCFALDTHAGRGLYQLDGSQAVRTGESAAGVTRLGDGAGAPAPVRRYLEAVQACRQQHGASAYPGSPWLLAHALREQDAIASCELHPEEAQALRDVFRGEPRVSVHERDGYAAMGALLPPRIDQVRFARGLVLIDPPYERQLVEFDIALAALTEGLRRWPQACYALWYPIKLRRSLNPFLRAAAALEAKSALTCELLVRSDDSPLRMNGSGMLLLNPPWQLDQALAPALAHLRTRLGEPGASHSVRWLRTPP